MKTIEIARELVKLLEEKKGEDILLLDLTEVASFTDYFLLCNGTSIRMLNSLRDEIQKNMRKHFHGFHSSSGDAESGWIAIDLGDIVVHLFSPQQRNYYQLEKLWEKGKVLVRLQ